MKSFILHKYVDIKFYFGGNTKTKLTDNLMISKLLNSSDIVYWGDHFDHLSKEKINKLNLNKEIFEKEFNLSTQYHLCFSSEWGKETNGTVIYDFQPQKREMLINDVSRFFMDMKSKMNQDNIVYSSIDSNKIVNLSLHSAHKTSFGASFNLKAKYLNDYIFNKFKENNKISKIDILNTLYNPFSTIPNQISYIFNID